MATRRKTRRDQPREEKAKPNQLCCCPPVAYVWIETESKSVFVENSIKVVKHLQVTRQLDANANAEAKPTLETRTSVNASVNPPGGPAVNADSLAAARSQNDTESDSATAFNDNVTADTTTHKDQGKVYRTDCYVVHWRADGDGPLQVSLDVAGILNYGASWLPPEGSVRLSKNYLLKPPDYDPGGGRTVTAKLTVRDCCHHTVSQENTVERP